MDVSQVVRNLPLQDFQLRTPVQNNQQTKHNGDFLNQYVNKKNVKTTVEKVNDFIDPVITNLKFIFHEDLHEYYVTVVDPITNEVIKEIPPKKMLDMYVEMAKYMGLLIDEKV